MINSEYTTGDEIDARLDRLERYFYFKEVGYKEEAEAISNQIWCELHTRGLIEGKGFFSEN